MNSNTVITISRQYGCGGRELAEILAKKLNVKLYDENDVNIETNYAYTDDWTPGEKTQFEFSTSETFSTVKLNVDFVDAE